MIEFLVAIGQAKKYAITDGITIPIHLNHFQTLIEKLNGFMIAGQSHQHNGSIVERTQTFFLSHFASNQVTSTSFVILLKEVVIVCHFEINI